MYIICNCCIYFVSLGSWDIECVSRNNQNKIFIHFLNSALEMLADCAYSSIVKKESNIKTQSSFCSFLCTKHCQPHDTSHHLVKRWLLWFSDIVLWIPESESSFLPSANNKYTCRVILGHCLRQSRGVPWASGVIIIMNECFMATFS